MALLAGTRLGPYEIHEPLGAGGMGEVYRARDTRLGRDTAIKVLPAEVAADAGRLKRLEQEARSASALNHPNILTIHDIGKHGSTPYIAMEYVQGKTLRAVLDDGPLPTKKLLQLASQIAEGLAKAHSAGIVHRDLKPENLMVTPDRFVKILDFGLAKLVTSRSGADSRIETMTREGTIPGAVMGTIGYMSPEQAKGERVDHRSDQFSFGAILYEMATATRAFQRGTAAETLTAIIREEPRPLAVVNVNLPLHLHQIVERCLSKEPEERYDSTRDLSRELRGVLEGLAHTGEVASTVTKASTDLGQLRVPQASDGAQEASMTAALASRIACSQLSMKNDICHITFNRTDSIADEINDIARKIPWNLDEVFFVNQGSREIIVICEGDKESLFKNILAQAVESREKSAVIRIQETKAEGVGPGIDVPGLYAFFMNQLASNGISILDIVSTRTQLTLVIDEEDVSRAYSVLNERIRDFRKRKP